MHLGVKESSNAHSPLKSVAEGLHLLLANCKVWGPSYVFTP